ncbi:MAG: ammonium transporter [Thermodesulfobacteriota bacterium]
MKEKMLRAFPIGALCLLAPALAQAGDGSAADTGTTAWMLTSTALVLLMVPGLAMFYGGLVRSKNVLGTMMHSFVSISVIGVLWAVCGYALAFGPNVLFGFIGWKSDYLFLRGLDDSMVNGVPEYALAMFQGKFAIITPALISGAIAERVTFRGYIAFIVLWFLFVYCPLCHWIWAPDGWLYNAGASGVVDLAGGLVIHVSAGFSALVAALYLGPRKGYPKQNMLPNNLVMTMIGAGLLWVGWFGFNAGSTVTSDLSTARALTMTQISAATGALTWLIIEAVRYGRATSLGFASGILAGLVAITPAAAVVQPVGAMALGALSSLICFFALTMKPRLGYDDSLDCFGVHGVGSGMGVLALSFFLRPSFLTHARENVANWSALSQLGIQFMGFCATVALAVLATIAICVVVQKTLGFRLDAEKEVAGLDYSLHTERGYGFLDPENM